MSSPHRRAGGVADDPGDGVSFLPNSTPVSQGTGVLSGGTA